MTATDLLRVERLRERMRASNVDVLVCRLPENVLYLTDYWPHHGFSAALLPRDGTTLLFVPEIEGEYADPTWATVVPFGWGLLKDGYLYDSYWHLLAQASARLGLQAATVGVEQSFEIVGATYRWAEPVVPAAPWSALLAQVFADAHLVDATALLQETRAVKTAYELEKLRMANEIAEMGMAAFLERLEPGMTEAQVGALIEHKIRADGPGYKNARLVRASAEVSAGPVGSTKATLLIPSTTRVVGEGDLVLVELATGVDGYWSDLTYVAVAGTPTARQREVHNAVLQAQQAAARCLRPGAAWSEPDRVARSILEGAGLGDYFVHITGHGVGFRYHESIPMLMPGAAGRLEVGMVSSVEPGVYIPGFGGVRIEDNVAVGADGPIFLSTPRTPW